MGAWSFISWQLRRLFEASVWYAGRGASASPAVGSLAMHRKEQQLIIQDAFTLG
jgi:2-oxoglutarate dehydrogenase E1 component